jgi:hypothetical protein
MRATFKIRCDLLATIHQDLSRPHPFAAERVGFVACKLCEVADGNLGVLANSYLPLGDDQYENDPTVGAMMNSSAIRGALQYAYNRRVAMFHIHRHDHHGFPRFSFIDSTEAQRFVPDFWKVQPSFAHGALVLSCDRMYGTWWSPTTRSPEPFAEYVTVGFPTTFQQEPNT